MTNAITGSRTRPITSAITAPLGTVMGKGGLPPPPFSYVINAKLSNTVKQREGIFGTGRRRVCLLGNSIEYGSGTAIGPDVTGGTTTSAARFPLAMPSLLRALLNSQVCRTDIDTIQGGKTIATSAGAYDVYDSRTASPNWTLATGFTAGGHFFGNGNTGQTFTFTPANTFDTVDIWVLEPLAGQSIAVRTAGVTRATIVATAAPDFTPVKYTVSVPAGSASVTIQKAGGTSTIFFAALETYTAANTGFSLVNGGWAGAACTTWTDNTQVYSPAAALPILNYDVVVIALGLNDAVALGADPAQFKINYQALIDILVGAGAEIVLAVPTPCVSSVIPDATQAAYRTAVLELGVTNDCPVIDIPAAVGSYTDLVATGIMSADGVHWTNYARLATAYQSYFRQVKALGA